MDRTNNHRGHGEKQSGKSKERRAIARTLSLQNYPALCALPLAVLFLCVLFGESRSSVAQSNDLALPQEKHLRNIKQLTFGGENAEAYFSSDGKKLIFQSTREGHDCDQIYTMNIDGSGVKMISTGDGRTTCSYFFPGDKKILYSSTHLGGKQCPPRPDFSQGYVWAVYDTFDRSEEHTSETPVTF